MEIEINEAPEHRRRSETARNAGRALMALLLLAALAGAFGGGPLSKAAIESAGLRLEYQRVARFNSPEKFKIQIPARANEIRLHIGSGLLENIDIERIDPEPIEMALAADGQIWNFPVKDTNAPVSINIHYRPDTFGRASGKIAVEGGASLSFQQFYFP